MATKIQIRRGTAASWTSTNPTLSSGELGLETDTNKVKIGDGSTAWNSLAYFYDQSALSQSSASATYLSIINASATYIPLTSEQTIINTASAAAVAYADALTTSDIAEGTNQYFTTQRAIDAASATYILQTNQQGIINSASAAAVNYLVDSAPATLDTLNELAAALNDDANFSTTVTNSLANKLDASSASTTYLTQSSASSTYLTQSSASSIYQTSPTNQIFTTWTTRTSQFGSSSIWALGAANGIFVAAGDSGTLNTSTDAINWTTRTSLIPSFERITKVIYGNSWVIGGLAGRIRQSTDAISWTTATVNFTYGNSGITGITYGNGIFALTNWYSELASSTDGISWTKESDNGLFNASIAYGNNIWAIVGYSGNVKTSTDRVTWTTRTSNMSQNINSISFGNNTWVIAGESGQLRSSTDAITWVTQNSNFGNTHITSVEYGNGVWIAVGRSGQVRSSTNAITWVTQTSNVNSSTNLWAEAYGNGLWIIGGGNGTIRTSINALDSYLTSSTISSTYEPIVLGLNTRTSSYTLALSDTTNIIQMNVESANNLTVPQNSSIPFPIGTSIDVIQIGAGQTTLVADTNVTINSKNNALKLTGQWSGVTLYKRDTNTWVAIGDLTS